MLLQPFCRLAFPLTASQSHLVLTLAPYRPAIRKLTHYKDIMGGVHWQVLMHRWSLVRTSVRQKPQQRDILRMADCQQ